MTASKPQKKSISLTHPELVKEWDYEKNAPLIPDSVSYGSNKKAWWKCAQCGNEWNCQVQNRIKHGCPKCAQAKRNDVRIQNWIDKKGSLKDDFPQIAEEWDYENNRPLTPNSVTSGSSRKVWWKCKNGHEWKTAISNRTSAGTGCPYCSNKKVFAGFNDLETKFPIIANEWDIDKNAPITPRDVVSGSNKRFWWKCNKGHEWKTSVNDRTQGGRCPACAKENRKIQFAKTVLKRSGSLIEVYPELAREWHPTKNGDLKPSGVTSSSGQKVWWLCPVCKNAWEDNPAHRTHGRGCPYCSNHRVMVGTNDLQTVNPELAKEWHPTKNGSLLPSHVLPQSNKRVWWICSKCGHEWSAQISNRKDRGCPNCSAERKTSFPEQVVLFYLTQRYRTVNRYSQSRFEIDIFLPDKKLGIEYDGRYYHNTKASLEKERNKDEFFRTKGIRILRIKESKQNAVSENVVYYGFDAQYKNLPWAIETVLSMIDPCVVMPDIDIARDQSEIYGQYIQMEKENSLASKYPNLLSEWCWEKNGVNPNRISCFSNKKVWWTCAKCGNDYLAVVAKRADGRGCPYCAGKKVMVGVNDLQTVNPELAKEWHPTKNGDLKPSDVLPQSNKRVWWICKNNHEWDIRVYNRTYGSNCPYCSGRRVWQGYPDRNKNFRG